MRHLSVFLSRCSICWLAASAVLAAVVLPAGRVAVAQAITIGTTLNIVAGNGIPGCSGDGGLAINAELLEPSELAFDGAGNYYFVDCGASVVRKVAANTGIITTVASDGTSGLIQDIAVDSAGDLYIADGGLSHYDIRKIDASTGITSILVPSLPGAISPYGFPVQIAVDAQGNLYFVSGYGAAASVVRELSAQTGLLTVVAGTGTSGYSGDEGPATSAELSSNPGIAVDNAENLYIADGGNNRVRKVDAAGIITTVAGDGVAGNSGDGGPASSAELSPYEITFDRAGNLYIAVGGEMPGSSLIREVNAGTGIITTVAGNGTAGQTGLGGTPTSAELGSISGLAVSTPGNIYLTEIIAGFNSFAANQILEITTLPYVAFVSTPVGSTSTLTAPLDVNTAGTTITGISAPVSQGGKQEYVIGTPRCALNAPLSAGTVCNVPLTFQPAYPGERPVPLQVATSAGTFNFGMIGLGTGPQVALTPGIISTVAGNGQQGFGGNGGPAIAAELNAPTKLDFDSAGNLYILDFQNNQIRRVDAVTGIVTNVAGSATSNSVTLAAPGGIALDATGNLYIADSGNQVIREVSANTGAVTTVAGNGTRGFSGDGGPASSAELNSPSSIVQDTTGNLYIADSGNNRIRKVDASTGMITTIAGTGTQGIGPDGGPATAAELDEPDNLILDSEDNLYFTEENSGAPDFRIRKISAGVGIVTVVAGTDTAGYSGDGGPATTAALNIPLGIALDSASDLYIADFGNHVIREVAAGTGIITTIAGNGALGSTGDGGAASSAALSPFSLALDSAGNLYLANSHQGAISYNTVRKIYVSSGLLDFAATAVGTTSADSPQTATVSNIGNMPLGFTLPVTGTNPTISNTSFTLDNGGTCPQLDIPSSPATLASGNDCTLFFSFTPTTSGAISGTATVADNALNFPAAMQIIHLNGAAIGGGGGGTVGGFTLTATPASQTINSGSTATYMLSVAGTGGFTGAVKLTETGLPSGATMSLSPSEVTISGSTPATATLTIETTPGQAQLMLSSHPGSQGSPVRFGLLLLPLSLLGIGGLRRRLRVLPRTALLLVFILLSLAATTGLTGCANVGPVLNAQAYTITITGTSGSLQHSQTVMLSVDGYSIVKYGH